MSDEPKDNVIDIRDRLPPVKFGDSPAGNLAVQILTILTNDPNPPQVHQAALVVVGKTISKLLAEGYPPVPREVVVAIQMEAMLIADAIEINIDFKKPRGT